MRSSRIVTLALAFVAGVRTPRQRRSPPLHKRILTGTSGLMARGRPIKASAHLPQVFLASRNSALAAVATFFMYFLRLVTAKTIFYTRAV